MKMQHHHHLRHVLLNFVIIIIVMRLLQPAVSHLLLSSLVSPLCLAKMMWVVYEKLSESYNEQKQQLHNQIVNDHQLRFDLYFRRKKKQETKNQCGKIVYNLLNCQPKQQQ